MDLKNCIDSCTKINKNQGTCNVKWSSVPKNKNHLSQYKKKPLPPNLEMQKSLYEPSTKKKRGKGKKHKNKSAEEDETFQVLEIREGIREVGIGYDIMSAIEKRFKEVQKMYVATDLDHSSNGSSASFTTARTSSTEDSFLSASQDLQNLDLLGEYDQSKKIDCNEDKKRYKRNALVTGIIQTKQNSCFLNEHSSTNFVKKSMPDLLNEIQCDKENCYKNENKESIHKIRQQKIVQGKTNIENTCQSLKGSIKKDTKQNNHVTVNGAEVTNTSRNYFMNISDDCFAEFISLKGKKN